MSAPLVFFDIAGPDFEAQKGFYSGVFDWRLAEDDRFDTPSVTPMPATLRTDPAEVMIYLGVEDVAAALTRVEAHGGKIVAPRFEIPGVVVLGIFLDPAGNRLGLVEMEGGRAKLPRAGARSDRLRVTDFVQDEIASGYPEFRPGRAPSCDMVGCEVRRQGLAAAPELVDVDQAGIEHVLGIAILDAARLGAARGNHRGHCWSRLVEIFGRYPDGSDDQQVHHVPRVASG